MAVLSLRPARGARRSGGAGGLGGSPRHTVLVWCCAAVAVFSVWLRTGFPVHAIPGAAADDGLFVALARHLVAGHWLGPFDNLTLVKGPFYPAFIAAAFAAGVPLKLAEHVVYLAAAALIVAVIRRHAPGRDWLAGVAFCALALNPVLWTNELARVIREGLYIGLSLAVIGCSLRASFASPGDRPRVSWCQVCAGMLAGAVGGCLWLTREEGLWLAPAVVIIVTLGGVEAWAGWRAAGRPGPLTAMLWRVAGPVLAGAAVTLVLVGGVAAINRVRYGAFEVTEVQSNAFRRGYGALARIRPDRWQRYVVFPREARLDAYRVSPAARALAPVLDGAVGAAWRKVGCGQLGPHDCREIAAGWFQWALRDAVAAAGHYGTAADAAAFYTALADQIDAACRRGAIACLPPRTTLAPPLRLADIADAWRAAPVLAGILLHPGRGSIGAAPSQGSAALIDAMAEMVGPVMPGAEQARAVRGWVNAAQGPPALHLQGASGGLAVGPAPDVVAAFPRRHAVRFTLDTACGDCVLIVTVPGGVGTHVRVDALHQGSMPVASGVSVFVDRDEADGPRVSTVRRAMLTRIARAIAAVYGFALTPLCALACVGVAVGIWRRDRPPALRALALASLIAVATRIALLSYLQVTAIPSANTLYASPAEPLLIVFAVLGCWLGWPGDRSGRSTRSEPASPVVPRMQSADQAGERAGGVRTHAAGHAAG